MSCKSTSSIREFETPIIGRVLWVRSLNRVWVRSLNREIINNSTLRMKGDVINNKHPRYYNTTHTTHKCFQRFFTPHRSTRKTLSSTVLSVKQVLQSHRETHRFFAVSAVQLAQQDRGLFHFHRVICSVQLKSRIGLTLTKAEVLRIMF